MGKTPLTFTLSVHNWILCIANDCTYSAKAKDGTVWRTVAYSNASTPQKAICEVAFAGDMYSLTAILLAEAAMVLVRPDRANWAQESGGGVLTPSTLGEQYIDRLRIAGLKMDIELVRNK